MNAGMKRMWVFLLFLKIKTSHLDNEKQSKLSKRRKGSEDLSWGKKKGGKSTQQTTTKIGDRRRNKGGFCRRRAFAPPPSVGITVIGGSAGICSFCSELCASKRFLPATICPRSDLHESWQTWLRKGGVVGCSGGGGRGVWGCRWKKKLRQSKMSLFYFGFRVKYPLPPERILQMCAMFLSGKASVPTRTQTVCDTLKWFLTARKNRRRLKISAPQTAEGSVSVILLPKILS